MIHILYPSENQVFLLFLFAKGATSIHIERGIRHVSKLLNTINILSIIEICQHVERSLAGAYNIIIDGLPPWASW